MASEGDTRLNVVAIVQARMGSRRFPGKVLASLCGRPVLEWVVDAVKRVDGVDSIVVATTTNSEDEAIERWCEKNTVSCFRGEPLDVLKRYSDCAEDYGATHVVRITADCPLLDSETVSAVLREGLREGADYFGLDGNFPDGFDCEGFRAAALYRANAEATLPSDREHVTPFLKRAENGFHSVYHTFPDVGVELRLTLDAREDMRFLSSLLREMRVTEGPIPIEDIVSSVRSSPDLLSINGHIRRNEGYMVSLAQDADFKAPQ